MFGDIQNPLDTFGSSYGGLTEGGLVMFIANILRLVTTIAGLWAFINIILAGMRYITAGNDASNIEAAWKQIYMSLIGLIIIAGAYTITAVISTILYGDPGTILEPAIYGPSN